MTRLGLELARQAADQDPRPAPKHHSALPAATVGGGQVGDVPTLRRALDHYVLLARRLSGCHDFAASLVPRPAPGAPPAWIRGERWPHRLLHWAPRPADPARHFSTTRALAHVDAGVSQIRRYIRNQEAEQWPEREGKEVVRRARRGPVHRAVVASLE